MCEENLRETGQVEVDKLGTVMLSMFMVTAGGNLLTGWPGRFQLGHSEPWGPKHG